MLDFDVVVKYKCKNICESKDLRDKTPYEIYLELSQDCLFNPSMFSEEYELVSVNISKDNKHSEHYSNVIRMK